MNAVRNFVFSRKYYIFRTPICGLGKSVLEEYLNQMFPHGHIIVRLECSIPRRLTSEEDKGLENLRTVNGPAEQQEKGGAVHVNENGDAELMEQQAKEQEYLS
ncbi:hypothetical protein CORC01_06873 [Colletotrichum orchidophilum]|uniref:Uncharacterized protein n=1 Tax=Colletotrichum orchidophilum TaxID=1209926 RepID=A0A1G4B8R7_9PEZI|nr:uncharacterized protein CORC01_06873 [Colletotrichum orchidophilum]OHE97838.1 hypothetical protein CORC01_06873 [Colletotrichum orchidophilum]